MLRWAIIFLVIGLVMSVLGFGGLGGGTFCPKLTFGGGGAAIGSVGVGVGNNGGGLYMNGKAQGPTGYPLPSGVGR